MEKQFITERKTEKRKKNVEGDELQDTNNSPNQTPQTQKERCVFFTLKIN